MKDERGKRQDWTERTIDSISFSSVKILANPMGSSGAKIAHWRGPTLGANGKSLTGVCPKKSVAETQMLR